MPETKIYLSAPAEFAAEASLHGPVSVMAYRVGRDRHLYRLPLPARRFALMEVDGSSFTGFGPHRALIGELTGEARRRGYRGLRICLPRPTPQLCAFAGALDAEARRLGLALFLPEAYAHAAPAARLTLPAQNTAGTFEGRISKLRALYGPERLAPTLERAYTDFALPARTGHGTALRNPPALLGTAFYAAQLCANYASYARAGRAHLVVWDDLGTLRRKLSVLRQLGIGAAFLYYPHAADLLPALLGQ